MAHRNVISITDAAADRIKGLLADRGQASLGVRLGTRARGCSGLAYTVDYVDEPILSDEVVEDKGVRVYVDAQSLLYLIGSEMDFKEDVFAAGFTFTNPNAKGQCGCGESFHV
ncbi:HesB/IscA family protein [Govanella unica]|uniref:Iron-sulfur cluster assembly accessory protein n=1 Tax=Govanella unica TaxID=2975056 RepID=A0A9X3TVN9_9PROT|nr:iron-sulfur cluster assembly accessory protein [Govania unica]MDA5192399.1 iron-sulfur cluster assembly accessory protein [Govania unica]